PGAAHNPEAARMILDGVIRDLDNPELASQAANTISLLGDMPVEALRTCLTTSREPMGIRKLIPEILLRIGTSGAAAALAENLVQADAQLRFKVICALNKLSEE